MEGKMMQTGPQVVKLSRNSLMGVQVDTAFISTLISKGTYHFIEHWDKWYISELLHAIVTERDGDPQTSALKLNITDHIPFSNSVTSTY